MTAGSPGPDADPAPASARLGELAWLFFRLGATGFGGPAAHVALMEHEVVRRRGWLSRAEFLDLLGATNLIPGPNSTEMAIHLGRERAGWAGLAVAGACFIAPAAAITLALAWAYVKYGARPEVAGMLYGVKPVIIAVVAQALWGLGRAALKSPALAALAAAGAAASALGAGELAILLASGLLAMLARRGPKAVAPALVPIGLVAPAAGATLPPLGMLFLIFLKVGSVLYGSGYVLLAFLRSDLVERLGWMTEEQLLDAVAIGQFTPGPVSSTATFVGYVLAGLPGATVATLGIFLPSFVFVAISGPLIPKLRGSPMAGAFLDGVNAASLALMAVVTWQLGRAALVDAPTVLLAAASLAALLRRRVNSAWLVLSGAALGLAAGPPG